MAHESYSSPSIISAGVEIAYHCYCSIETLPQRNSTSNEYLARNLLGSMTNCLHRFADDKDVKIVLEADNEYEFYGGISKKLMKLYGNL